MNNQPKFDFNIEAKNTRDEQGRKAMYLREEIGDLTADDKPIAKICSVIGSASFTVEFVDGDSYIIDVRPIIKALVEKVTADA